jgi:DNA-binding NarL/FixJ family response regulator
MSLTSRVPRSAERVDVSSDHALMRLTPRERQVAIAVAGGASNRQVASALSMAPRTVECHLAHIYLKLDITSRVQLAVALVTRSPDIRTLGWSSLNRIEQDIAALVGAGMGNKRVAELLFVSSKTVEHHLRHVYRTLRVTSRSQLPSVIAGVGPARLPAIGRETQLAS